MKKYLRYGIICPQNAGGLKREGKSIMKKVLSIILVMVMLVSSITLVSCSSKSRKPDDLIKLPEAEYKAQCQTYEYDDIMRYPDNYNKKMAVFKGEVVQVLRDDDELQMRVDVTYNGYYYEDTVFVFYTQKTNENFLEGDIIVMYGELRGTQKYESVLGATIEIPRIYVQYIDLVSETTT